MAIAQVSFGMGFISVAPPAGAADPTQIYLAEIQKAQVEISIEEVDLEGQAGAPIARAFGKRKITCKAQSAKLLGGLVAAVLDGSTTTSGSKIPVKETGVVTAGAVTVTGSATFVAAISVRAADGTIYKKVASAPTGAQFTATSGGVYGFNVTENNKVLQFVYTKTQVSGSTITLPNISMGLATSYSVELFNDPAKNAGSVFGMDLPAVTIPKLSLALESNKFLIPDFDFSALDDGLGNFVTIYMGGGV